MTKGLIQPIRALSRHFFGMVVAAFLAASPVLTEAATEAYGAIAVDTIWSLDQSPYLMTADVTVVGGATLTIEPGVTVQAASGVSLIVSNGSLSAKGTALAPVVFTSVRDFPDGGAAVGDWGQLIFLDGSNDANTVLEWASVRYGSGVRIESASPTLNRLTLINNAGAAISMDLKSSPIGSGLQAFGNGINGIKVPAGVIDGVVDWRLLGIPYVLEQGEVSVGKRPAIASISPGEVQRGQTIDALISGTRLSVADEIIFESAGISAVLSPGGTDSTIPVRITASESMPLLNVPFSVQVAAGLVRYETGVTVIAAKPDLVISGISPAGLRRAESKSFRISGSLLQGAQIAMSSGGGLSVSNVQTSQTDATFTLSASASATLGEQTLTVSNPAVSRGSIGVTITVGQALPRMSVSPAQLAVPPDGSVHSFSINLTNPDDIDHTVNLAVGDPSMVTVMPSTLVIPAGTTQVGVTLTGLKLGYTTLTLTSPALASASTAVYVTSTLNGATVGPLVSPLVGVRRPTEGDLLPVGANVGPIISPQVRVTVPSNSSALLGGTSVGPLVSPLVGVKRPVEGNSLPASTNVGPILSPQVRVMMPVDGSILPIGTGLGPLLSPPIGVTLPVEPEVLP